MKLNEHKIVQILKDQLKKKYIKILIRKYPSNSSKIKNSLLTHFGYIPSLRPEIDMIFLEGSGRLNAAEVKFFKKKDTNFKIPFYKGIDQALSLYRYGFDNVALWHFFDSDIDMAQMNKYGAEAWHFIRSSLQLRLNFSYFKITKENAVPKFQVMQYINKHQGFSLKKFVDDPQFVIVWRYGNPLLLAGDKFTLNIRQSLVDVYGLR